MTLFSQLPMSAYLGASNHCSWSPLGRSSLAPNRVCIIYTHVTRFRYENKRFSRPAVPYRLIVYLFCAVLLMHWQLLCTNQSSIAIVYVCNASQ